MKGVLPAAVVCGVCFASVQFLVSNFIGPQLVDIMAALTAIIGLVVLLKVWQPKDNFVLAGEHAAVAAPKQHGFGRTLLAWSPYLLLVAFVLVWGYGPSKRALETTNIVFAGPGCTTRSRAWRRWSRSRLRTRRTTPSTGSRRPARPARSRRWPRRSCCASRSGMYVGILGRVLKQMAFSLLTIACVLGLAYVMNYSGAVVTLGLAFAATGALFPFFSALVGWLGVFLTGSDTSANALFGNLQVVTANSLGFDPAIMAASNSSGGVMGKMISLQSLAVAVAATGMARSEEGKLFRFTVKHSVFLAAVLGVITTIYAYAA